MELLRFFLVLCVFASSAIGAHWGEDARLRKGCMMIMLWTAALLSDTLIRAIYENSVDHRTYDMEEANTPEETWIDTKSLGLHVTVTLLFFGMQTVTFFMGLQRESHARETQSVVQLIITGSYVCWLLSDA